MNMTYNRPGDIKFFVGVEKSWVGAFEEKMSEAWAIASRTTQASNTNSARMVCLQQAHSKKNSEGRIIMEEISHFFSKYLSDWCLKRRFLWEATATIYWYELEIKVYTRNVPRRMYNDEMKSFKLSIRKKSRVYSVHFRIWNAWYPSLKKKCVYYPKKTFYNDDADACKQCVTKPGASFSLLAFQMSNTNLMSTTTKRQQWTLTCTTTIL